MHEGLPRPSTRQDAATKADGPLVSQGIGVREWLSSDLRGDARAPAFTVRTPGPHPEFVQGEQAYVGEGG